MIKHKYVVSINDKIVFRREDDTWTVRTEAMDCITKQIETPFQFSVSVNGLALSFPESWGSWKYRNDVTAVIKNRFAESLCGDVQILSKSKKGEKGSAAVGFLKVTWECVWSGRAPARPKAVIAAEKAVQAVKAQVRKDQRAKYQAEADARTVNLRQRIKNQVDHAFSLGKHGTESAAKYITCQHCDGPAAVVCLSQPLARGAAVLDEDTIVGALCQQHIEHQPWGYYSRHSSRNATKVPCDVLEFFYDGIRQIAIKS